MTAVEYAPRGLLGVLTPQANTTVEPEFTALLRSEIDRGRQVEPSPVTVVHAKALQAGVLVTLQQQDVARFLQKIASEYDLVFIDPPYEVNNSELIGQLSALTKHLADGALVCIERSSRSERLTPDFGFSELETKTYGDTAVSFWQFAK
jgi:16S rRNA (guanine966-N2)-methyltransferase